MCQAADELWLWHKQSHSDVSQLASVPMNMIVVCYTVASYCALHYKKYIFDMLHFLIQ